MIDTVKEIIKTDKAPAAIGPYSQAVKAGNILFTSGQIAINLKSGQLIEGGIQAQTEQVLQNVKNILEAAGSSLEKVVKVTIFLNDMGDFTAVNQVYSKYFGQSLPARSCAMVAELPRAAKIEVEAIALINEG